MIMSLIHSLNKYGFGVQPTLPFCTMSLFWIFFFLKASLTKEQWLRIQVIQKSLFFSTIPSKYPIDTFNVLSWSVIANGPDLCWTGWQTWHLCTGDLVITILLLLHIIRSRHCHAVVIMIGLTRLFLICFLWRL